jgi:hypothetical protein
MPTRQSNERVSTALICALTTEDCAQFGTGMGTGHTATRHIVDVGYGVLSEGQ